MIIIKYCVELITEFGLHFVLLLVSNEVVLR